MNDRVTVDPNGPASRVRPQSYFGHTHLSSAQWRLLAFLLPLLATALFLAVRVPRCSRHGMGFHLEPSHQHVVGFLFRGDYADPRFGVLLFDLDSGEVTESYDELTDLRANRTKYSSNYYIQSRERSRRNATGLRWHEVSIFDPRTESLKPFGEFEFPNCNGCLVGERFFVGQDHLGVLHAIDLEDLENGIQTLAHRTTDLPMVPVFGTDRFVLIRHEVPEGTANLANPIIRQVELFGMTDQGQIQLIRTWPIGAVNGSNFGACSYFGDQIASISPDCQRIEFHHCEDGRPTESFPLPNGFDPLTMHWSFDGDILEIRMPNEAHWFDVVHQHWMPNPKGARRLLHRSDDERMLVFGFEPDEEKVVVTENREDAKERVIQAPARASAFVAGDRIAIMSDREVASGKLHDLDSGEIEQSWRPFAWVTPTLALVLIGFAIWSAAWIWLSAERQTAIWIDALLVVGVPLLCVTVRAMWIGGSLSLIPMEYARGIAIGSLAASFVWVLLTETRWAIRLLPPLIVASILLVDASLVYVDSAMEGWYYVAFGLLHGSLAALPWAAVMLLGFRFTRDQQPPSESDRRQYPLRDLFLWVLTLSILFASLRLMTDRVGPMQSYDFYASLVSERAAILFGVSVVALIPQRHFQLVCTWVAIAGYLFLVSQCLDRLESGSAGAAFTHFDAKSRVMVSGGLTCYVLLSMLRLRGMRLKRTRLWPPRLS